MVSSLLCTITFVFVCISVCSASFSWSNCGTQLHAGINYVGASISPDAILTNQSVSINVKATVVSVIDNANTTLTIWKDGELFLSVAIQDLCTIVRASTNSMSCPIPIGDLSFTYTFNNVPSLIAGDYTFMLQSVSSGTELGCLLLAGSVSGLVDSSQCSYTSSFHVSIDGTSVVSSDQQYIQVGPYGQVPTAAGSATPSWGIFTTDFVGTADIGGTVDTTNFVWGINATLYSDRNDTDGTQYIAIYTGNMFVGYLNSAGGVDTVFVGKMNWTITHDIATNPADAITGYFWFDPEYSYPSGFEYPVILGNLGPFSMQRQTDGSFLVTGERNWCTCGLDACGVCGGDGTSCIVSIIAESQWSVYRKTAVGVGIGGGIVGAVAVAALFYVLLKTKSRNKRRHDDQDLIDTPEKPDYGTLAIDEAIQEGDRV